jgi:signal transduction histidine kinase
MAVQKGQCQRQTPKALSKIAKLMFWSTRQYTDREWKVLIKIEDSGPNFPPNFPIFEPYNSTDPQSTGLGLATVKELIEKHGGLISAEDSPYGGACIKFTIPFEK